MSTETLVFNPDPGLYVLLLSLESPSLIRVGALGEYFLTAGLYAYIGSAKGPGGLRARLKRHLRPGKEKKIHWHIDYLLQHTSVQTIFYTRDLSQSECKWASAVTRLGTCFPPRFGASDCSCPGHLIQIVDVEVNRLYSLLTASGWERIFI
ncbi:MAG: GIY-YIG nuclease family protein [Anaerolineales bacterium]|nr:GIY-YIG nuclease family protein [Anaerolineales bacterium]